MAAHGFLEYLSEDDLNTLRVKRNTTRSKSLARPLSTLGAQPPPSHKDPKIPLKTIMKEEENLPCYSPENKQLAFKISNFEVFVALIVFFVFFFFVISNVPKIFFVSFAAQKITSFVFFCLLADRNWRSFVRRRFYRIFREFRCFFKSQEDQFRWLQTKTFTPFFFLHSK